MQLGFLIDHSRCIGCHACTVACKAENDVPLGAFRTWVKYTEEGEFPQVKRSFAVLRCNQCTNAPCIEICPVNALHKRDDGVVDVASSSCIGCKGCMQACPYDALYINDNTGTAEKCHFCVHRTERGLAPACAVVCPVEAIIPLNVEELDTRGLSVRKPEAGTGPNVFYKEVNDTAIQPLAGSASGGYLWANTPVGQPVVEDAPARTTYDVPHPKMWGWRVSLYLFTKALAAGIFPVAYLLGGNTKLAAGVSLFFLLITTALLVFDLKRPERFLLVLLRPNFSSWLVKGAYVLMGYGALLTVHALIDVPLLGAVTTAFALLSAAYSGWLLGQAKGRVLWLQPTLPLKLILEAAMCGLAFAGLAGFPVMLLIIPAVLLYWVVDMIGTPSGRKQEYQRARELMKRHWQQHLSTAALGLGVALIIFFPVVGGLLVLTGIALEDDRLIDAGQELPIS